MEQTLGVLVNALPGNKPYREGADSFVVMLFQASFLLWSSTIRVDSARPAPHPFGARGFASRSILLSCKIATPAAKKSSSLPDGKISPAPFNS